MGTKAPWGLIDAGTIVSEHGAGRHAAELVASEQHRMISTRQLRFAGLTDDAIRHGRRSGRLHPIHRGVYAVGHPQTSEVERLAAGVLAIGSGTTASHAAGGWHLGLLSVAPVVIHVSIAGHRRCRPGIVVHRCGSLPSRDRGRRDGIPVTSVARTILDIADLGDLRLLGEALNTARLKKLIQQSQLAELRSRTPGRHGWAAIDLLLREEGSEGFSRSRAERAMKRLITRAGLPVPRRNVRVLGHELDFYWPELRLNVEVDGWQWHAPGFRANADRDRDTHLAANGIQAIRFTRDQLRFTPQLVVARLAAAIALAANRIGAVG